MTTMTTTGRVALLLALPLAGLVALLVFEIMRGLAGDGYDPGALPPVAALSVMLCLTATPVIALCLSSGAAARWLAFGIASLLTLFHAMHVVEHAAVGDWSLLALIAITMLLPSGAGAGLLWTTRKQAG
ncbi:MAG: hypothetical protein AAGE01_23930 [Pseudomonadota bacterium]